MKYWVDPPSGWQYGFPMIYDTETDGDLSDFLEKNGVPEELKDFPVRMWEVK